MMMKKKLNPEHVIWVKRVNDKMITERIMRGIRGRH